MSPATKQASSVDAIASPPGFGIDAIGWAQRKLYDPKADAVYNRIHMARCGDSPACFCTNRLPSRINIMTPEEFATRGAQQIYHTRLWRHRAGANGADACVVPAGSSLEFGGRPAGN